jgi:REP element-mobilizing transposase RayT
MRARQLSFLPQISLEHGGQLRPGKRKVARPIDPKRPLHLVLRASRARGQWSMLRPQNEARVKRAIDSASRKHQVRVYRYVNVGNHLHLLVLAKTKPSFRAFIREITGVIAALVTGSKKTRPNEGKFWDFLPYTKIVTWGRELKNLERYFIKNLFEAAGALTQRAKAAGLRVISISAWVVGPPR